MWESTPTPGPYAAMLSLQLLKIQARCLVGELHPVFINAVQPSVYRVGAAFSFPDTAVAWRQQLLAVEGYE